jgi:hypothetical protein
MRRKEDALKAMPRVYTEIKLRYIYVERIGNSLKWGEVNRAGIRVFEKPMREPHRTG